jgi:hypothetical protein
MTLKYNKLQTLALGALFVMATFALAPGPANQKSTTALTASPTQQRQQQSDAQAPQVQWSGVAARDSQSRMIIFTAVDEVDKTRRTVILKGSEGSTMEMEVPEKALADLVPGDSVKVVIHATP